jgi:LITAF-like zinc ribbon domain
MARAPDSAEAPEASEAPEAPEAPSSLSASGPSASESPASSSSDSPAGMPSSRSSSTLSLSTLSAAESVAASGKGKGSKKDDHRRSFLARTSSVGSIGTSRSSDRLTRLSIGTHAPSYNYITARPSDAAVGIAKNDSFRETFGLTSSLISTPTTTPSTSASSTPPRVAPAPPKAHNTAASEGMDPRYPPRRMDMTPVALTSTPIHTRCGDCGVKAHSVTKLESCTAANAAIAVGCIGIGWLVLLPCWLNCMSRTLHSCPECGCHYGEYTPVC